MHRGLHASHYSEQTNMAKKQCMQKHEHAIDRIRTCEHMQHQIIVPIHAICIYRMALLRFHFFCVSGIAIDCNGDWTGTHFVGGEAAGKDGISQGYLATLQIIKPRLDKAFDSVGQLHFISI